MPRTLEVPDLDTFEPCGLFDREISTIIDSSDQTFATDEDLGRKDPETGEVWTLAWVRVRKPDQPSSPSPATFQVRWRFASWPARDWVKQTGPRDFVDSRAHRIVRDRMWDGDLGNMELRVETLDGVLVEREDAIQQRILQSGDFCRHGTETESNCGQCGQR